MFETMHSFLFFFIPTLVLIITGIIFEEHLINFEQKIKKAVFKKNSSNRNNSVSKKNVALSPVSRSKAQASHRCKNNAA